MAPKPRNVRRLTWYSPRRGGSNEVDALREEPARRTPHARERVVVWLPSLRHQTSHLTARAMGPPRPRRPLIVGRDRFPERPLGWQDGLAVAISLALLASFVALLARWP